MNNFNQIENESFTIDLEAKNEKKKQIKLIYCGDGVLEECEEDELEKEKLENEKKQKEIELKQKLDMEAKNLTWIPWVGYMVTRTAQQGLEVCDIMGEKLAWWFGITKPKFLYEIEEYNRMKQEEAESMSQDFAEEIIIDSVDKKLSHESVEMKFF